VAVDGGGRWTIDSLMQSIIHVPIQLELLAWGKFLLPWHWHAEWHGDAIPLISTLSKMNTLHEIGHTYWHANSNACQSVQYQFICYHMFYTTYMLNLHTVQYRKLSNSTFIDYYTVPFHSIH
jgi:hypothetical protein